MTTAEKKKRTTRVMEIAADDLRFDEAYQRKIVPARVRALRSRLDLDGLGVISVSLRKDGQHYVIDGQHRVRALLDEGLGEWKVKANVYSDLKEQEEAALFLTLNNTRVVAPIDRFRAGVTAHDPDCLGVLAICQRAGLKVDGQAYEGHLTCVQTALRIYRTTSTGKQGDLLRRTLDLALKSWGATTASVEGKVLDGLALVLNAYGDELEVSALEKKLAKVPGGPAGLLGMAKGLKEHRGGTLARCVAVIVVDLYNRGRRVGALAPL